MPGVDAQAVLLFTVALLPIYTVGIGGTTAVAIGVRDAWRRRAALRASDLDPTHVEVVLAAPTLPRPARWLRIGGWAAFPFALLLGLFANSAYSRLATFPGFLGVALLPVY